MMKMGFVQNVVIINYCQKINVGILIHHASIKDRMGFVHNVQMVIMKKMVYVMRIVYKYLNAYNVMIYKKINVYYVKKILF